jgi:serine/threonine-protein kinase
MLHRDIKAENIIVTPSGEPVLIDLGLADSENSQPDWSKTEINGTPLYLSPEYIDGEDITIKSDLYALGVTLFYAVSGRFPFKARSPMAILAKHLNETPPELTDVVPGISQEFSDLVNRMLIKKPEKRISLEDSLFGFKKLYKKFEE